MTAEAAKVPGRQARRTAVRSERPATEAIVRLVAFVLTERSATRSPIGRACPGRPIRAYTLLAAAAGYDRPAGSLHGGHKTQEVVVARHAESPKATTSRSLLGRSSAFNF